MQTTIIPRDISGCTAYIHSTDNNLNLVIIPTNWERLELTAADLAEWHQFRTDRDAIIELLENPLTRTSTREKALHDNGIDFIDFASPLVIRMKTNPLSTSDDAALYHFTIGRADPTHQTVAMTAHALGTSHAVGGGI